MPWTVYDKFGNTKQSAANVTTPIGMMTSSGTVNHASSGSWVQLTGAVAAWLNTTDTVGTIVDTTNGKLTAPYTGRYQVSATVHFAANATGLRGLQVNKNSVAANTNTVAETSLTSMTTGINHDMTLSDVLMLNQGDYLSLLAYQSSGGTLNMASALPVTFSMVKIDGAIPYAPPNLPRMAYGTSTITFTASATSNTVAVPHGLGSTPTAVLFGVDSGTAWLMMQVNTKDATNINVTGHDTGNATRTGSQTFYWMAIL